MSDDKWNPQLVEVIQVFELLGDGTEDNPYRRALTFYSLQGEFLARNDPCMSKETESDD